MIRVSVTADPEPTSEPLSMRLEYTSDRTPVRSHTLTYSHTMQTLSNAQHGSKMAYIHFLLFYAWLGFIFRNQIVSVFNIP